MARERPQLWFQPPMLPALPAAILEPTSPVGRNGGTISPATRNNAWLARRSALPPTILLVPLPGTPPGRLHACGNHHANENTRRQPDDRSGRSDTSPLAHHHRSPLAIAQPARHAHYTCHPH